MNKCGKVSWGSSRPINFEFGIENAICKRILWIWLDMNPEHVRAQDQDKDYFTIKPIGLAKTAILIAFNMLTKVNSILYKFTSVNIY